MNMARICSSCSKTCLSKQVNACPDSLLRLHPHLPSHLCVRSAFNPALNQYRGGAQIQGTLKEDQRFMVWMRLSHMPRFRKLWGIMENQQLRTGDVLNITVSNFYNSYSYSGSKYIVLSTTTWLGGNSIFLGVAYLVTGGLSLLMALVYMIIVLAKPRPFADTSRLRAKPASGTA